MANASTRTTGRLCYCDRRPILCTSIRRFAASELGIKLRFEGHGVDEVGIVESVSGEDAPAVKVGDIIVAVDPRYFRPAEVETLLGDPSKAHDKLGWKPETTLQEMVVEMVRKDLEAAKSILFSNHMVTRFQFLWSKEMTIKKRVLLLGIMVWLVQQS